jgi:hypothetical protein
MLRARQRSRAARRNRPPARLRREPGGHRRAGRAAAIGRAQDPDDPAGTAPRAAGSRRRVLLPRLQSAPLRRRSPSPPLGPRRRDQAVQPPPALPPSPPAGTRGRLRREPDPRWRRRLLAPRRPDDPRGSAEPPREPPRAMAIKPRCRPGHHRGNRGGALRGRAPRPSSCHPRAIAQRGMARPRTTGAQESRDLPGFAGTGAVRTRRGAYLSARPRKYRHVRRRQTFASRRPRSLAHF